MSHAKMPTVVLLSADNISFTVDIRIANMSHTIKNMNEFAEASDSDEKIPLVNVTGNVLEKVIEWATHHVNDPASTESADSITNSGTDLSTWDREFMETNKDIVYDLILASNFLDINGLLELGCKTVGNWIKETGFDDPEKIRRRFQVQCDYTSEELQQVHMENSWGSEI